MLFQTRNKQGALLDLGFIAEDLETCKGFFKAGVPFDIVPAEEGLLKYTVRWIDIELLATMVRSMTPNMKKKVSSLFPRPRPVECLGLNGLMKAMAGNPRYQGFEEYADSNKPDVHSNEKLNLGTIRDICGMETFRGRDIEASMKNWCPKVDASTTNPKETLEKKSLKLIDVPLAMYSESYKS